MPCAYVRIVGSGRAVQGACIVRGVIFAPDANADYVDIYDGLDATSGERVCRIESSTITTQHLAFGDGVQFHSGVYVSGIDSAVETTILFNPGEL